MDASTDLVEKFLPGKVLPNIVLDRAPFVTLRILKGQFVFSFIENLARQKVGNGSELLGRIIHQFKVDLLVRDLYIPLFNFLVDE